MSDVPPKHMISAWLESEIASKPDCKVVGAIRASTTNTTLNEVDLLKMIRELSDPQEAFDVLD